MSENDKGPALYRERIVYKDSDCFPGSPEDYFRTLRGFCVYLDGSLSVRSLVVLQLILHRIDLSLSCHLIAVEILVVGRDLVDQLSVRQKFHDAVGRGLHDLMVARGEQLDAWELDHTVIQGGDGFHVKVVRRLVEDQDVGAGDHHFREHTAHALASGEDLELFDAVLAGEQHAAEEAADVGGVLDLGILGQPVRDAEIAVKLPRVVFREIRLRRRQAPLVAPGKW